MSKKLICILFCILAIVFIFFNSSKNGTESNYISKSLVNKLIYNEETIEVFNSLKSNESDFDLSRVKKKTNSIVRKLAHFTEYFILAFVLVVLFNSFNIRFREGFIYSLFIVLIIAVLDEFYQMYIPDRTSLVKDVIIDFIGGIFGALISILYIYIKRYFSKEYNRIH